MREIYFDNSATTRVLDSVKDIVVKTMTEDYGNPAAMHLKGVRAEDYIKKARGIIARSLKAQENEILFTSGGSESNNMALIGAAMANKRSGNHIISSGVEHASVYNTLSYLEEQGFEVTYLPVDKLGHVNLLELSEAVRPETILVSIMYVNNEVGSVEPVEEIAACIKKKKPDVLFHVDAIQAYGKYRINPKRLGIDLLSASGHKIHGPKGVGFLYLRDGVKVRPLIYGGGQQKGMRSGTENVPGAAGLGEAVRAIYENHEAIVERLYEIKNHLIDRMGEIEGVTVNSQKGRESAPQIVSVSFEGVRSEVLLHALEDKGIYASAGSACSSHTPKRARGGISPNHPLVKGTLQGIGVKKELLDSTLRFSFGIYNTKEEADECIGVLKELLPVLRRYQRG